MWEEIGHFALSILESVTKTSRSRAFADVVQQLSRMTSYEVTSLHGNQATFRVPGRGKWYPLIVTSRGQDFLLQAVSLIEFPPGQTPGSMVSALTRLNSATPNCSYELCDTDKGSKFVVKGEVRGGSLASVFAEAANDLADKIAAVDVVLRHLRHVC